MLLAELPQGYVKAHLLHHLWVASCARKWDFYSVENWWLSSVVSGCFFFFKNKNLKCDVPALPTVCARETALKNVIEVLRV